MRARLFINLGFFKPCIYARNLNTSDVQGVQNAWGALSLLLPGIDGKITITFE